MQRLDAWPGYQPARAINKHDRALHTHGIDAAIHRVPGHSAVPWEEEADFQAITAGEDRGFRLREPIYMSDTNWVRWISELYMMAKANSEANKSSKHYGFRLKAKAGSKRSIPTISVKSLATTFYRLKRGNVLTGRYLKPFGHPEDEKCWW
jgi:hypothetical protein